MWLLFIPTVFSVLQEDFEITIQAQPVVAADRAPAFWAAPFLLFGFQEVFHAILFD